MKAGFDELITATLLSAGKAIIYTSLALALGFSVFTFASFKPLILFGILMAVSITATNVGALLVLPSIIKVFKLNLIESEDFVPAWKTWTQSKLLLGYKSVKALTTLLLNGNVIKK